MSGLGLRNLDMEERPDMSVLGAGHVPPVSLESG
jgi:hypothetical protein